MFPLFHTVITAVKVFFLSFADEASQVTEYGDDTDVWKSEEETDRVNDYWPN